MDIVELLSKHFGWREFRPLQREIIESTLAGNSCLAVLPTGGGKSLCYQLPALALSGVTLVVSPLISLMKDQVDALTERKIPAIAVNSQDTPWELQGKLADLQAGRVRIVYVAPERLKNGAFLRACLSTSVSLIAVDEAHCVSQWGHDFRPDYRFIRDFHQAVGKPPLLALTATATRRVQDDIVHHLGIEGAQRFIAGVDRPNLWFGLERCSTVAEKRGKVAALVARSKGSTIVYVSSRREADELSGILQVDLNEPVGAYHAGLSASERTSVQNRFMAGLIRVVVATNAFGMGIDKPDIRAVIHAGVPDSMESYYQEVGRAGRDGQPAECTMVVVAGMDVKLREFLLEKDEPTRDQLDAILGRVQAVRHQNEGVITLTDQEAGFGTLVLSQLQTLGCLELVERSQQGMRIRLTNESIEMDPQILWQQVQEHIKMKQARFRQMRNFTFLDSDQCRRKFIMDYFGEEGSSQVGLCCSGCHPRPIEPRALPQLRRNRSAITNKEQAETTEAAHPQLLERLKKWRWSKATERGVPSYVIFGDRDLEGIAAAVPTTNDELAACRGVGPTKLALYGEEILAIVAELKESLESQLHREAYLLFSQGVGYQDAAYKLQGSLQQVWQCFLRWIVETDHDMWKTQVRKILSPREYITIRSLLQEKGTQSYRRFHKQKVELTKAVMKRVGEL